jgi:phage baseplate assembly protein W
VYPPSTPKPELRSTLENESAQQNQGARLAELLARADQAAQRIAVQKAERQAGSQYAARMELEAQAGAGQEPEARDELELEL